MLASITFVHTLVEILIALRLAFLISDHISHLTQASLDEHKKP